MISTDAQLTDLTRDLEEADLIAVDLEADSLHSYPERLCLIQVSIPGRDDLVDLLADVDLSPMLEVLRPREMILHGADFDLRLLRRNLGFVPERLFDTAIAARLVGERQFGLTSLLDSYLGVKLAKGMQKANWARRPLSPKMIEYALNDTRYLEPLASLLRQKLEALGRLEWHRESCDRLIAECAQPKVVDQDRVWRLRGSDRLEPKALAVLRALWRWREREAVAHDRPPFFVVSHQLLVELARDAANKPLRQLKLPQRLSSRRTAVLREVIDEALATPADQWPEPMRRKRSKRSRATKDDPAELKRRRDKRAAELGIDPTLIANRDTLERLAGDLEGTLPQMMAWQREVLGFDEP